MHAGLHTTSRTTGDRTPLKGGVIQLQKTVYLSSSYPGNSCWKVCDSVGSSYAFQHFLFCTKELKCIHESGSDGWVWSQHSVSQTKFPGVECFVSLCLLVFSASSLWCSRDRTLSNIAFLLVSFLFIQV